MGKLKWVTKSVSCRARTPKFTKNVSFLSAFRVTSFRLPVAGPLTKKQTLEEPGRRNRDPPAERYNSSSSSTTTTTTSTTTNNNNNTNNTNNNIEIGRGPGLGQGSRGRGGPIV